MVEILSRYLIQHQNCPLPGIGYLKFSQGNATISYGNKEITSPTQDIVLEDKSIDGKELIQDISTTLNISFDEASTELKNYCSSLKFLGAKEKTEFDSFGCFAISSEGKLVFNQKTIPPYFLPNLSIEKIIRQNSEHSMLVGNTETTNIQMEEFYQETNDSKINRWWIAAIVMVVLGIAALILYFNNADVNRMGGNSQKIIPSKAEKTYR